jgi:hypothetical protein
MARKVTSTIVNLNKIANGTGYEKVAAAEAGSSIVLYKGYSNTRLSPDETNKLLLKLAGCEFKDLDPADTRLKITYSAGKSSEDSYWLLVLEEEFDFFAKVDSEISPPY